MERQQDPSQPSPTPTSGQISLQTPSPSLLLVSGFSGVASVLFCSPRLTGTAGVSAPHPRQSLAIQGKWGEWKPCVTLRRGHTFMVKGPEDKVCALG